MAETLSISEQQLAELKRLRAARRDLLDAAGLEQDSQADLCCVLREATAKLATRERQREEARVAAAALDRYSAGGVGLGWLSPARKNREEWWAAWRSLRSALGLGEKP